MIRKTFEFKGQQVNYYNKLANDTRSHFSHLTMYTDAKTGEYVVEYIRAKVEK